MESLKPNFHSPREKKRKILQRQELQEDVRRRYSVIMPSMSTWNMLPDDLRHAIGANFDARYNEEELIMFWRVNKERYDFMEAEERREIAFFHRRAKLARNPLRRQLCEHFISILFRLLHLLTFVGNEPLFCFRRSRFATERRTSPGPKGGGR